MPARIASTVLPSCISVKCKAEMQIPNANIPPDAVLIFGFPRTKLILGIDYQKCGSKELTMHGRLFFTVICFCLTVSAANRLIAVEPSAKVQAPDADVQAEATKLVKEVYGSEGTAAKTAAQKQALAKKLLQKARDSANDKPGQFVLLRMSKEFALQVPDSVTAFEAIAELDKLFVVDALAMQADTLAKVAH